jgi:hypothetical protein
MQQQPYGAPDQPKPGYEPMKPGYEQPGKPV